MWVLVTPRSAQAQEESPCGWECVPAYDCGHVFYTALPGCLQCHNDLSATICAFDDCISCTGGVELPADWPSTAEITDALEHVTLSEVADLTAMYGSRLRVHPGRHMVVVLGGCDGQALTSMVYLEPEIVTKLGSEGVESLDRYLEGQTAAISQ